MRKVYRLSDPDDAPTLLAEFEMQGDDLTVRWHDEGFQLEMERWGILTRDSELHVKDGQPFFDALPRHYSHHSHVYVADE